MSALDLLAKFSRRIDAGIDFPAEGLLGRAQRVYDFTEGHIADDHDIDVAAGLQLVSRGRPIQECDPDPRAKGCERRPEHTGGPGGFREQRGNLWIHRRGLVRLEIHLPALSSTGQQAGGRQLLEFSLDRADCQTGLASDLPEIEGLVGMAIEPAEHEPAGTSEQHDGRIFCTHFSYDCTNSSYVVKQAA